MEPIRCAIIGSGFAGSTFAEAIRYAPDATLAVIAGGHQASDLAARYGATAEADVDAVLDLDAIDAVLIASPNPVHAAQVIRAARAGKHVLVEKPMGMNVAECRAMIAACQEAGVVIMPGFHHRFRRNPVATKLLLDSGAIGRVDLVSMVQMEPDQSTWLNNPVNGGYLLGSTIHGIDLLRFWIGDIRSVVALTGHHRGVKVENGAHLLLQFASGATGSNHSTVIPGSVPPPGSGVVRFDAHLTGETGAIVADMYGEVRKSTRDGWDVQTSIPVFPGHTSFLRIEAFAQEVREFIAAISERRAPRVTGEDGLLAVAVIEAAHRSAAERRWVDVAEVLDG